MKKKIVFGTLLLSLMLPLNIRTDENGIVIEKASACAASNITGEGKSELFTTEEVKDIQDFQTKYWNIRNNDVLADKFEIEPIIGPSQYTTGKLSKATLDNATAYLNLVREKAGVAPVAWTEERTNFTQYGVVGMASVGYAGHYLAYFNSKPENMTDDFWKRADDAVAASSVFRSSVVEVQQEGTFSAESNGGYLDYNVSLNGITDVFLSDYGYFMVRHRFSMLNYATSTVGFGYADIVHLDEKKKEVYGTVYIADDGSGNHVPADHVISWPTEGTFPTQYLNEDGVIEWSAAIKVRNYSDFDRSKVKVTLTNDKTKQQWVFTDAKSDGKFTWFAYSDGYRRVVFEPDNIKYEEGDSFTVRFDELTGIGSHEYSTKFYDLTKKYTVPTSVSAIEVAPKSAALAVGQTQQLTTTISPSNATNKNVTWSSSNSNVAAVDANGKVTAKAEGTANITAKTEDGNKTAVSTVTVVQSIPVSEVQVTPSRKTMNAGETLQLTATVLPENASNKNIIWRNGDTKIATVDVNGKVTAVSPGWTIIYADSAEGKKEGIFVVNVNSLSKFGATKEEAVEISPVFTGKRSSDYYTNQNGWIKFKASKTAMYGVEASRGDTGSYINFDFQNKLEDRNLGYYNRNTKKAGVATINKAAPVYYEKGEYVYIKITNTSLYDTFLFNLTVDDSNPQPNYADQVTISSKENLFISNNIQKSFNYTVDQYTTKPANTNVVADDPGIVDIVNDGDKFTVIGKKNGKTTVRVKETTGSGKEDSIEVTVVAFGKTKASAGEFTMAFSGNYSKNLCSNQNGWIKFKASEKAKYDISYIRLDYGAPVNSKLDILYFGEGNTEFGYKKYTFGVGSTSYNQQIPVYEEGDYVYMNINCNAPNYEYFFNVRMISE